MSRTRAFDAFARAVDRAVPGAAIEQHDSGELVIYTGKTMDLDKEGLETGRVRDLTENELLNGELDEPDDEVTA